MNSASPPSLRPGFLRRNAGKLVLSAVITASLLFTLEKGGLKLWPDGVSFGHVRFWTIGPYFVTLFLTSYYRAVRWRYLLRSTCNIPRRRVLAVSWIGFAAILIMPFRLGEIVRPFMIRERGKLSMSAATGTVLAERVIDGLYLSIILAVALIFVPTLHPLPQTVVGLPVTVEHVRASGFVMLGVFGVAFVTIAVFYFARTWAHKLTLKAFSVISPHLGEKLAGFAERLADGLHFLGRGRDAIGFLFETSLYWWFNVLGMWLLAWGCNVAHADGSAITLGETCALMGMLGITILIPGPPGLLGVFQAGVYAGMTMYFPTSVVVGQGAAYVFLLYGIQVVWTLCAAGYFLLKDRNAFRQLEEAEGILPATADA